ncbi:hypothetical protein SAMN05421805_11114 [Saccharopolyspora antimicrobica]|uniref:Uncharacterized protein n=1 Tax=Saccharopolyspora antimicrobica TaxID=455193 RepID=A0A1I5FFK8_9PSEU|nr:hypothetical protein [Saccharopolyspora antimicrobica]RKT82096.1 hypothetical protein ATL45_0339 [Saccharopolyspora antimicrobica]SFO22091.1 hypothetical protein SAMN05421805_11114 [Saccharopolyspora antimicrobica]
MTKPRRRLLLPGCLLVVLSALFGIAGIGVIVAGSVSGAAVDRAEPHSWTAGDVVLQFNRFGTCEVVPESGAPRVVEPKRQVEELQVQRWFSGTASITCDQPVTAWQGSAAGLRSFVSSSAFEYGLATLVVLPLLALVVLLVRRSGAPR